ncbi:MAG: GNAT family N-acetyltransferase [Cyanobacteria bacterium REEB459]|nr:GNAT family N-acetyltransferase [Cyanobacteria bacterium REEB459]
MADFSLPGYHIKTGSSLDRSRLVRVMERHQQELTPHSSQPSMEATVDRYLSSQTPLWWVWPHSGVPPEAQDPGFQAGLTPPWEAVACLWLGQAIDQSNGCPHPYILLLYVSPHHRRRGVATALLQRAHSWAREQGYRQISLQVWTHNQPAQALYRKLGYQPQAILMKSCLEEG